MILQNFPLYRILFKHSTFPCRTTIASFPVEKQKMGFWVVSVEKDTEKVGYWKNC